MGRPIDPARRSPPGGLTDEKGAFRQAVAFEDLDSRPHLDPDEGLRHRRRPANRELQAGQVVVADRRLQQGGVECRHARERRHAEASDNLPEAGDDVLSPIALGRGEDNMVAAHPRLQAGDELTIDVEQRQPAQDGSWRFISRHHLRHGPGVEHLISMRPHRNLRRARRTAGADIRRYVVGAYRAAEQTVGRLLAHRLAQIDDLKAGAHRGRLDRGAGGLSLLAVEVVGHVDECDRPEVGKRRQLCGKT
jgi:hypothetical protein